jgi:hypothetical protein
MMTKILVYGYCVGVFSSRRLRKRLQEDVAFRMLAAGNESDYRCIRLCLAAYWTRARTTVSLSAARKL